MPLHLFLPLAAAITYALGSIYLKKALAGGAPAVGGFHLSNFVLGIFFLPLLFSGWSEIEWASWYRPVLTGLFFFAGMGLTFVSIRRGDVSLVTPLMGTKVVFVAVAVVLLTDGEPSPILWLAAGLTATGIFVMGIRDMRTGPRFFFTVAVTLASAGLFGVSDVLVQKWAADFTQLPFLAVMALTVTLCSGIIWIVSGRIALSNSETRRPMLTGSALTAVQAILIGLSLAYFDNATGVNVVYASRGLWAILLVYFLGRQLGNRERETAGASFLWRSVGTVMLTVAIILAVWDGARQG